MHLTSHEFILPNRPNLVEIAALLEENRLPTKDREELKRALLGAMRVASPSQDLGPVRRVRRPVSGGAAATGTRWETGPAPF